MPATPNPNPNPSPDRITKGTACNFSVFAPNKGLRVQLHCCKLTGFQFVILKLNVLCWVVYSADGSITSHHERGIILPFCHTAYKMTLQLHVLMILELVFYVNVVYYGFNICVVFCVLHTALKIQSHLHSSITFIPFQRIDELSSHLEPGCRYCVFFKRISEAWLLVDFSLKVLHEVEVRKPDSVWTRPWPKCCCTVGKDKLN